MDAFTLAAKLTLDSKDFERDLGKQEGVFKKFGGTIAKVAGGLAIGAAVKKSVDAVVTLTKTAVESYANYEQLVGGVETLFGTGGKNLEDYAKSVGKSVEDAKGKFLDLKRAENSALAGAKNAYKTAGLSMNQYMETVTSFAASLVAGLSGDTIKAVEYADMAITDMSDNANKMGTSMEAIQNAYQGFAKQNYTMLDNLKLGYGGTKTEMERLIADANKVKEAHGEMADLSIERFSDVVEAIHLIQNEMGITGTTAQEAEHTISGSINAMKASWANLLVAIASGNMDIGTYVNQLVNTATIAFDNIMPVVENALTGIASFVEKIAPIVAEKLPGMVKDVLPKLLNAAGSILEGVINALPALFATLFTAIGNIDWLSLGTSIWNTIKSAFSGVAEWAVNTFESVKNLLVELAGGESTAFGGAIESAWNLIKTAVDGVSTAIQTVIGWFNSATEEQGKTTEFGNAVEGVWNAIKGAIDTVSSAIETFIGWITDANATTAMSTAFGTTVSEAWNLITTAVNAVSTAIETVITWLNNVFKQADAGNIFGSALNASFGLVSSALEAISTAIQAAIGLFSDIFSNQETAAAYGAAMESAWGVITTAIDAVSTAIETVTTWFTSIFDKQAAADAFGSALQTAFGLIAAAFDGISTAIDTVLGWFTSLFERESTANAFSTALQSAWNLVETAIGAVSTAVETVISWFDNVFSKTDAGDIFGNALDAAFGLVSSAVNAVSTAIETVIGWFESVFSNENTANAYGTALQSVWNMIETAISAVSTAIDTVIGWFADLFGQEDTANLFGTAIQTAFGLISGAADLISAAINTVIGWFTSLFEKDGAASTFGSAIKSAFQFVIDAANAISSAIEGAVGWLASLFGYDGKSVNTTSNHTENTYKHTYNYEHWVSDGGKSHSGSGGKFAKAMFGGKILHGATVFGMDDNGPMVGGEAGPEAVVGVNSLNQQIREAVRDGLSGIVGSIAQAIGGRNEQPVYVVLDTGELVGAIGGKMDAELGKIGDWKGGGRA